MFETVQARRGIAVAPHHLAAQSAQRIMREGGSAIEAMVAAAATISVVYPHMNSIGGDGFWLIMPPEGEPTTIDASGPAGSLATLQRYQQYPRIPQRGPDAALTVAGTVDGWREALAIQQERSGTCMPLPHLLEDAIHYAREGVAITASQAHASQAKLDQLRDVAGFADTFLEEGKVPAINQCFKQPRLADTLDALATNGLDDFYRGEVAASLAADMKTLGMPITQADLAGYHAKRGSPLKLSLDSGDVYNLAPPTQGLVSQLILGVSARLGLADMAPESVDYIHALVESTKRAFSLRDSYITDPAEMTEEAQNFLASEVLQREAAAVSMEQAASWGTAQGPGDTIWMGAIDDQGMAVSFIQSIYHEFGSGVVLPGSGITWQNRGAAFSLEPDHLLRLRPGKQPFHTLNPAAARLNDGRTLVYGSMGGDGQPQTQAAIYSRYVLFNEGLQRAITAPRWLLGRTWGDTSLSLKLESRFAEETIAGLKARGHQLDIVEPFSETMGHAGACVRHADGGLEGAFDPRSNGGAAGY